MSRDPWIDSGDVNEHRKAIATVARARMFAEQTAHAFPELSLIDFAKDLSVVETAYHKDAMAYRRTRPLVVVQLPSILGLLGTMSDLQASGNADPQRMEALGKEIELCLASATKAREMIQDEILTRAEIEAATTAEQVTGGEVLPNEDDDADHDIFGGKLSSYAGRMTRDLRSETGRILGRSRRSVSKAAEAVGSRLSGGKDYAMTQIAGYAEDSLRNVAQPLGARLVAAREAAMQSSVGAIVGGGLCAIVFPPAVPFVMGIAALEAPDYYAKALQKAQDKNDAEQRQRKSAREEAAARAVARFRGESSVVRLETPHLYMTMDVEKGTAEGIILAGQHMGRSLEELDASEIELLRQHAPDDETMQVLASWQKRTADLTPADDLPSPGF